jgi:two-component system chemotaxis response regulator CheY
MQTEFNQMKLPPVLDLSAAEGFLATMRTHLQDDRALRIDASEVATLTLPCIQILLAAIRDHEHVSIEGPSIDFVNAFEDLGLDWKSGRTPAPEDLPESVIGEVEAQDDVTDFNQDDQKEDHEMPKKILTIDDSKTIRDMLMLTLSDAGFDVVQAVDGQDGLDVLGDDRVDVIITDINMPRMDGYEVIRQLRQNAVHKTTPILVLTTESDTEKRNLARQAGATGWMVKPFDPDSLIATVRKVAP